MSRSVKSKSVGQEIIAGLEELDGALRRRTPLEEQFTVRTVEGDLRPHAYNAAAVKRTRRLLGTSQVVFARVMGVSAATVEAWEQGTRTVNLTACRLLDEINYDPKRWIRMLRRSMRQKRSA